MVRVFTYMYRVAWHFRGSLISRIADFFGVSREQFSANLDFRRAETIFREFGFQTDFSRLFFRGSLFLRDLMFADSWKTREIREN